jgi:hypothetical protein
MPSPERGERPGDEPTPRQDDLPGSQDDEETDELAELPEREALSVFGLGSHPIVSELPHDT